MKEIEKQRYDVFVQVCKEFRKNMVCSFLLNFATVMFMIVLFYIATYTPLYTCSKRFLGFCVEKRALEPSWRHMFTIVINDMWYSVALLISAMCFFILQMNQRIASALEVTRVIESITK